MLTRVKSSDIVKRLRRIHDEPYEFSARSVIKVITERGMLGSMNAYDLLLEGNSPLRLAAILRALGFTNDMSTVEGEILYIVSTMVNLTADAEAKGVPTGQYLKEAIESINAILSNKVKQRRLVYDVDKALESIT